MKLTRTRLAGPVLAAGAAAVIAGCGGSSTSSSSPSSSTGAAASQTATTAANATSSAAAAAKPISITTKHDKNLGTILAAGDKRMTVYLWEADKGTTSVCSGVCAHVWPPVIGKPSASGSAKSSDLGTTSRADGSVQVTYKGHPLYYFIKDKDDGDAYGQGSKSFHAPWYVMRPNGSKVDNS